jgi:hypothetical protein
VTGGWIGVDLDGTLAEYYGWNGGIIGEPIAPMVKRVKAWLAEGNEVRILTARVAFDPTRAGDLLLAAEQVERIKAWCLEHVGAALPVTASKDLAMVELWDDRAVQVETNVGEPVDPRRR